jgi:hypothetical protein
MFTADPSIRACVYNLSLAWIAGSNPAGGMHVCLFAGRGLCDGPISRTEKFYQLWRVTDCNWETSKMRRSWPALSCCAKEKIKYLTGSRTCKTQFAPAISSLITIHKSNHIRTMHLPYCTNIVPTSFSSAYLYVMIIIPIFLHFSTSLVSRDPRHSNLHYFVIA